MTKAGARARTPSQRARRDRIVQAAASLLDDRSYERIHIREVAAAADVSLATLYRYFRSKEQLYAQVLLDWVATYQTRLRSDPTHPEAAGERLRQALRRAVRAHERHPHFFRVIAVLEVVTDPAVSEIFAEFSASFYGALGETLEGLATDEAEVIRTIASAVLEASLRQWALGRKSIRRVYVDIDTTVDLIFVRPAARAEALVNRDNGRTGAGAIVDAER
jgi:AcrR family transcriptional regulator